MNITTNNQYREFIYWQDLSEKEQKDFDWIKEQEQEEHTFFRYKGRIYSLSEFLFCTNTPPGWSSYSNDTYFSGIVIAISEDGDSVKCGTWYN